MSLGPFNSDMLRLAREAHGLTQAELARSTGVTQALVSKIENGLIVQPGEDVVAKFAELLRFPPAFFHQQERAVGFPHFHHRKRARLGAKPLARLGAIINIRRQHIAKLMRSFEPEVAKPIPQMDLDETGLTPESVADRLRSYWMIRRGPVPNMVELVEDAGGIVILARFGTALLDGISFRSEALPPLFFMNKEVAGDRFRFSLAHELGHIVMHTVPDNDAKMEEEAHRFAAAFLMPAMDIKPYLVNPKLSTLGRVKAFWKVSIKALIRRAYDLKLVTDLQYNSLNVQYSKSFRRGEPVEIEQETPSKLREIVAYHRDKLGYTMNDLAQLLAAHPADVERAYLELKPGLRLVVSN